MHLSRQVFIIFTITLLYVFGAHTSAQADFYVIAGGGKKIGTEIKALPYTINAPGFYYATGHLTTSAGSHGITIELSHVTIDLMGFTLAGPGGTGAHYHGIYAPDAVENIEIRNGNITEFQGDGIAFWDSDCKGVRIVNIKASHNGRTGIYIPGFSGIIEDCISFSNGINGISGGSGYTITGNSCYQNGGIGISVGGSSTISGNACYYNVSHGISSKLGCTIQGNSCRDNGGHGILAGTYSGAIGNSCYSNTDHGIYLHGNNYAGENTCVSNGTNMNSSCGTCTVSVDNHAP